MPSIHILIGPPASGKSTWREKHLSEVSEPVVVLSTDDMIEEYAAQNGMNYTEAFAAVNFPKIEKTFFDNLRVAIANSQNVIVDRTNMRIKSRNRILSNVSKNYKKIAVVFDVSEKVLFDRLHARAEATGKSIPKSVVLNMIETYQDPTSDEFDIIIDGCK